MNLTWTTAGGYCGGFHTHLCTTAVARTDGLGWGVVALVVLYTAEMEAVEVVAVAEERASSRKKKVAVSEVPNVERRIGHEISKWFYKPF